MPQNSEFKKVLEAQGRFSVEAEISGGANAFTFKARDNLLARDVFLKIIYYSPEVASDLLQEPRALEQATKCVPKPENLVQVFSADIIEVLGDQYLCLQMEFVEGQSLLTALAENSIGQQDSVNIARGILYGLARLHFCRILHRDLKPANIMLCGAIAKISDFGSAAILPFNAISVPASRHSALYVPPEGWAEQPRYTIESDIYQVGLILYELINGAFDARMRHYLTPKVLRESKISRSDFENLDDCDKSRLADKGIAHLSSTGGLLLHGRNPQPYFARQLHRIIGTATKTEPTQRYSSATEFISKLNQIEMPNWRPKSTSEYRADGWRGWNWIVSGGVNGVVVTKARPDTNKFRRIPGGNFNSLQSAFIFVEDQE